VLDKVRERPNHFGFLGMAQPMDVRWLADGPRDFVSQHNPEITLVHAPIPLHPTLAHLPLVPGTQPIAIQAVVQLGKKRKRKSDDEKEERSSKRILLSQKTYGLLSHQDVALRPLNRTTVAKLQEIPGFSNLLSEYQASTYQAANPMDANTMVDTWQSIRLTETERRFHQKPTWRRAQAVPPAGTEVAVADPVFYAKEPFTGDRLHSVRLKGECVVNERISTKAYIPTDCQVAQIRVIFRIASMVKSQQASIRKSCGVLYARISTDNPV
jgi:hypothetical protein